VTHAQVRQAETADVGVEGNSRLTSATGVVLLLLLAVEGVTILRVRQLITLHVFLGVVLIGPVLLKSASTVYRFARYYRGTGPYRVKGPPPMMLRMLGPVVIATSLLVLGSGVGLLTVRDGQQPGLWLTVHKASFILWFAVMTVHVLGHWQQAVRESWTEVRPRPGDAASRRRSLRMALVVIALLAGVGGAAAAMPAATPWTSGHVHHGDH
jgi:hypothetical protein